MADQKTAAEFWLGDRIDYITEATKNSKVEQLMMLASYRRAIANFVSIMTKKNIPVVFAGSDSYTTGKSVVITSKVKPTEYDALVGLALHEASHIELTDFTFFSSVTEWRDRLVNDYGLKDTISDEHVMYVKSLLNWVEDRRIDWYIYRNAPGYRAYYRAMYNYYFNSKENEKVLQSDEYTDPTWESYLYRIINITNPNSRLTALPKLDEIARMLDLKNVGLLTELMKEI